MLSGKSGMLLTDRAAYFDNPRSRVPIEAIVYPPVTARGSSQRATLPTAAGPVPLPDALEDCSIAMLRALRAVAFHNRGASRFTYGASPVAGPVGALAAQALRHPELRTAPSLPSRAVHAASNIALTWLDHDTGEELLCFLDETVSHDGSRFVALTDRRLIAYGDTNAEIPYAALTNVSFKSGMLTSTFVLSTAAAAHRVDTIAPEPVARAVCGFLMGLGGLPPEHRCAWPPGAPSPDDRSGAVAALRSLSWPDVRVATLLELIHASTERGVMSVDAARDMVARALRLQRTIRGGHGRSGVMQRSPLGAQDLEHTLAQLFGAPIWHGFDSGGRVVDFELGRSGSAAGTIASNVVGLTLLAVVGFGWVSTGGSRALRLRARIWEAPGGAGFTVHDASGAPLAREAAKVAGGLFEALAEASAATLLRRVLLGWERAPDALSREPLDSLDARARALVSHADIAPFFAA